MSALSLKSYVTRRPAEPVDQAERAAQLEHHQAASTASTTDPKGRSPEKPKREANQLQAAFLASNLNRSVAVYLMNGVKMVGILREFDQFTVMIEGPDGVNSLTYKHAVSTIAPAGRFA